MTDMRVDAFDPRDLPDAYDAPDVERDEADPASHDDADNPDVAPTDEEIIPHG